LYTTSDPPKNGVNVKDDSSPEPHPELNKIQEIEKRLSNSLQDLRAINTNIQQGAATVQQGGTKVVQKIKKKVPKFLRKKVSKDAGEEDEHEVVAEYHKDEGDDAVFYRTDPLLYDKFGNMVIFRP